MKLFNTNQTFVNLLYIERHSFFLSETFTHLKQLKKVRFPYTMNILLYNVLMR